MGTFATAVTALVPAIGTLAKDVVTAIKGSASPQVRGGDGPAPSGATAKAISADTDFKNAVGKKQPHNAANAAAAAIPEDDVKAGAAKSVSDSGAKAKTLGEQLSAVVGVLDPCYDAEDNIFAIKELDGKSVLDEEDKKMLSFWWAAADGLISSISAAGKNSFEELGDSNAINAFQAIARAQKGADYLALAAWMKSPGDSVPEAQQIYADNLWLWLKAGTVVGMDTIKQIVAGLNQIAPAKP
jgi:hypothetical protein